VSKFTDAMGQEWRLELDGFLLDRIEKEAKVDLADLSASGLFAVTQDAKALIRVLAVACEHECKECGKSTVEFQKRIRKDAITDARRALLEALADFFPQSEWSKMLSNLTKRKSQPDMTPEQFQLAMEFLKTDPETRLEVLEMIRQEMMDDGSSDSSQDNVSASDQDATPSMPADASPENAGSAPEATLSATSG